MPSKKKSLKRIVKRSRCPHKANPEATQSVKRHRSKSRSGKRHPVKSFCRKPTGGKKVEKVEQIEEEVVPMLSAKIHRRKRSVSRR